MSQALTNIAVFEQHSLRKPFAQVVERLSDLSVRKSHDPFRDIAWDGPHSVLDERDPRFRLRPDQPLGASAWYQALPPDDQSRLGLDLIVQGLEFGIGLENTLSRGLLTYLHASGDRSPVYRYALHEVIEECKHLLMFRTFVERTGRPPVRLGASDMFFSWRVAQLAPIFPELFFMWVLAGEVFVDDDNRQRLAHRDGLHPLFERILQIHVTEEARHMHFAEQYVREHVPRASAPARWLIRAVAPKILSENARVMLQPSGSVVKRYGIPRAVLREAFGPGSAHHERTLAISTPILAMLADARTPATET